MKKLLLALTILTTITLTGCQKKMENYSESDRTIIKNIILKDIAPTEEQLLRYDMNADGKITSMDYVMIGNIIYGVEPVTSYEKYTKAMIKLPNDETIVVDIQDLKQDEDVLHITDDVGNLYHVSKVNCVLFGE